MTATQEFRLADRQANVAGITRVINRHLRGKALRRVEVRYSTQAIPALDPAETKRAISALLRELGMSSVEISVRPIDLPIDDALCEHVVRLMHNPTEVVASSHTSSVLQDMLSRWFPTLLGRQLAQAAIEPATTPSVARSEPRVSQRQAAELLHQAVDVAVRAEGKTTGSAPVRVAQITVRQAALDRTLKGLIARDAKGAAEWMGRLLAENKVQVAPGMTVRYAFVPPQTGEGTELAWGSDLEVQLMRDSGMTTATAQHPEATLLPILEVESTLLPASPAPQQPALTIRVLGTTNAAFAEPFVLHFGALPARFDRATLEAAGFGHQHGDALRVASQTCPLLVSQSADNSLVLEATPRPGTGGVPMYFRAKDQSAVVGRLPLHRRRERLLVNGPSAVLHPTTGQRLPALLIDIELGDSPDLAAAVAL